MMMMMLLKKAWTMVTVIGDNSSGGLLHTAIIMNASIDTSKFALPSTGNVEVEAETFSLMLTTASRDSKHARCSVSCSTCCHENCASSFTILD
jgi:hypothetical protein